MRYSYSRIRAFDTCPFKFKLAYIDRVKLAERFKSIEAFMGNRVHEALEFLYNELKVTTKPPTLKQVIEFFESHWKESFRDDKVKIVRSGRKVKDYLARGRRMLVQYYEQRTPFDKEPQTISIESRNSLELGNYKFQLLIDRLAISSDGTFEVHDYKTSSRLPSKPDIDADAQLSLYALFVKDHYGIPAEKIKLVWHFLEFGVDLHSTRTESELEAFKNDFISKIKVIEAAKDFPARESSLCPWCEFSALCPAMSHLKRIESLPTEDAKKDDGAVSVNRLAKLESQKGAIEAEIKEVKDRLFNFAKSQGVSRVFGATHSASVKETERVQFPGKNDPKRAELVKELRKRGVWDEVATLDTFALEKLVSADAGLDAALSKFESRKTSVRIALRERKKK